MLKIKPGVSFHDDSFKDDRIGRVFRVAVQEAPLTYDVTITSGVDGVHSEKSDHYTGNAVDIRIRDFPGDVRRWTERMQKALGSYYFVLLEKDHIHVSYKGPK